MKCNWQFEDLAFPTSILPLPPDTNRESMGCYFFILLFTPAVRAPTFFSSKKSWQKCHRCKIITELPTCATEIIELAM